jgi:hypothetical protein
MPANSFKARITAYQKLLAAVEAHEVELPQVALYMADFELALAEVKASKVRQADLGKRRKQATREVGEQMAECRELALRLKSLIVAHFGPKDERLKLFGIKLAGRPTRKSQELGSKSGSPGYH